MFPHAMRSLKDGRSRTRAVVLAPILALLILLVLPSGSAFAQSHAQARQSVPTAPSQAQEARSLLSFGIGSISYNNNLYVFVVDEYGNLRSDMWNGSTWHWTNQGSPPVGMSDGVGVTSWNNNLYVFVIGGDHHLWVDYWNRSSWGWYDQGLAPGLSYQYGVGAVSSGNYLYVFVVGSDHHLWVDLWNSSSWGWYDQGTPPNQTLAAAGAGAVITGNAISVFVENATISALWIDQWNGYTWQWANLGAPQTPGGAVEVCNGGGAVNYNSTLDLFIGDCSGYDHLWVDQWNGSFWQWYDQGRPPSVGYQSGAGAVSSGISLSVFFVATDWYLWVDYWNGSSWQWSSLGTPA